MARTGRFGNLPAAAPDLTATIVNLYEAYERQRDQNIVDAWQNGGEFEGKPVTDGRLLAWYKMRMDEVSAKDPMHDYWSDAYHQTRFAIAEQKANLAYTQEKMDESDMASFYKQWAKKLPRASAAWRDLMTSAARFAKAAKAGRASSGAEARAKALAARINAIQTNQVQPAYDLLGALSVQGSRGANERYGLGGDYYTFNANLDSAASMDETLAAIQQDPAAEAKMRAAIRHYIPGFDGNLTVPLVIQAINKAKAGIRAQARVYRAYGEKDAARERLAEARKFDNELATLRSVNQDLPDRYVEMVDNFEEDLAAANGAIGRQQVRESHALSLERLADQFERNGSVTQAGAARARAAALRGDEAAAAISSLDENFMGGGVPNQSGKATGAGTENGSLVQSVMQDRVQLDLLSKGGVLIYTEGKNGQMEEQIVPAEGAATILGASGGSRIIARDLAYQGGTFTFADGEVVIPKGTITEAAVEHPVVVSIPNPSNAADLVNQGLLGGTGLPTLGGATTVVGTRTDWGNGEIMWGAPVGPGGRLYYSDVPPFNGNGIRAQALKDGTWQVEYDLAAIFTRDTDDGALNDILADVIDPKTNQPVLDANGNVKQAFLPGRLAGGSPYISPNFDPIADDRENVILEVPAGNMPVKPAEFPDGLWDQMQADIAKGMKPESPEFAEKYPPSLPGRNEAASAIITARERTIGGVYNPEVSPDSLRGTPPQGVDAAVWSRMLDDRAAGMSTSDLLSKYRADFDRLNPGNQGAAEGLLSRAAAESSKVTPSVRAQTGDGVPSMVSPVSAQSLRANQKDWNRSFYAVLATHPMSVSWVLPSMHKASRSVASRQRWASTVDPEEFVKRALERDPTIQQDPNVFRDLLSQVDVLTGAGRSGVSEMEFARERMSAPGTGIDPGIALLVTSRSQVTYQPSVADIFGMGSTGSVVPRKPVPTGDPTKGAVAGQVAPVSAPVGGFPVENGVEATPPAVPSATVGVNASGAPVIVPGAGNSAGVVSKALAVRRAAVVRPSGVDPSVRPKEPKIPKIKPPVIKLPETPTPPPVPIGSGGQQTQRRPGGIILS